MAFAQTARPLSSAFSSMSNLAVWWPDGRCVVMFSDLTKKVTMQTLFHDGGFSSMGMSLRGMTQYNKSFLDENRDEQGNIIYG